MALEHLTVHKSSDCLCAFPDIIRLHNGDLGDPASVQLQDDRILTVYYFHDDDGIRYIAGSIYTEAALTG